jgi:diguanylate cyclase (GGDEF)-like protein
LAGAQNPSATVAVLPARSLKVVVAPVDGNWTFSLLRLGRPTASWREGERLGDLASSNAHIDGPAPAVAAQLRAAEVLLALVLDATGTYPYTAIIHADDRVEGAFSAAGYERLIGAPVPSGLQPDEAWRRRIHDEDRGSLMADRVALRRGEPQRLEYRVVAADGAVVWIVEHMVPRSVDGQLLVDGILIDVSVQRRLELQLREALVLAQRGRDEAEARSLVDPLTLIPNRRHFEERLVEEFAQSRAGAQLGLLLIDVDHFKLVNDTHGHPMGDRVLVEIARRLSGAIGEKVLVARWGGEEFCALAAGVRDEHDLRAIAETIRTAIEVEPIGFDGELECSLALTVSVGGALAEAGATQSELIDMADRALYAAKRRGRNQVRLGSDLRADEAAPDANGRHRRSALAVDILIR